MDYSSQFSLPPTVSHFSTYLIGKYYTWTLLTEEIDVDYEEEVLDGVHLLMRALFLRCAC